MSLAGQVALVTGASRGIGKAIAATLAQNGAIVIGTATSAAGAEGITAALKPLGEKNRGMLLNVDAAAAIEPLLDEIKKSVGAVAILVNNAGITRDTLAMRMKDEDWDAVIATNLSAVFRMSRAVLRDMMKAKGGRIINVTSVVGHSGNPGQLNYAAAKSGVAGMSRALAREIGSRNITVNCVAPGFIATDMTSGLTEAQSTALLAQIPLGRLGAVEDVAAAVAFLASPAAGYITGTTLHVNGGMYM
ncbi:MAG TPA: 3-oxoacyl-ACP reductase FabG [Burkholderiales bacterium]|jgi:3-oxoacyl-[acyl-carrier protein] reductase|nr:3-oxoacyl-ACP reductase FabG [Burkholderiales bacterium]